MSLLSLFKKPEPSHAFSFDNGLLRFVSIAQEDGAIHIKRYATEDLAGILDDQDAIIDEAKFVARLGSLAKKFEIASANVVVPDAHAICFHTHVTKAPDRQMTDVIVDHLATYCEANGLLSLAEYISEYEVILETQFGYDIHATLVPKLYVEHMVRLFKQAGIMVPHIETAHHAVARSCVNMPTGTGYIAVSFGKTKTQVSLVNGEHLVAHDRVDIGSDTIIDTIAKSLRVTRAEAERITERYGVLKAHPDERVLSAIYIALSPIIHTIDRQLIAIGQMPYKQYGHRFVTRDVLVYGDGAWVKGLVGYLGEETRLHARLLDVWVGRNNRAPVQNLPASDVPKYAEALALGLVYLS